MRQKGKIEQMLQDARDYRIHCYRRMQLAAMADDSNEDYSVQEYWQERTAASANAARLLDYIDIHKNKLSLEDKSELLLTAFGALNAGFCDYGQSVRALEMAEMLLSTLPDSRVKFCLMVYLYMETGDDSMTKEIEEQMTMIDLEEDGYLMNLYRQINELYFA